MRQTEKLGDCAQQPATRNIWSQIGCFSSLRSSFCVSKIMQLCPRQQDHQAATQAQPIGGFAAAAKKEALWTNGNHRIVVAVSSQCTFSHLAF